MRKWIIGLASLGSGLILTLLAVEFVLSEFCPHPRAIHQKILNGKNGVIELRHIINKGFVKKNSHGFRDKERSYEKKRGVFRILILGDSMTEALEIPLEQTFPYVLETKLNSDKGKRFEVINLGVSRFNTAQEYLLFRYYGLKYQPDLVILAFFNGDDMRDNSLVLEKTSVDSNGGAINNKHIPIFMLGGEKVGGKGFRISDSGYDKEKTRRDKNRLVQIIRGISVGVFPNIYYSLVDWVEEIPWVADPPLKSGGTKTKPETGDIPSFYKAYAKNYSSKWQNDWKVTKFLISKLAIELKKDKTAFLVVIIPNELELKPDKWNQVLHEYPEMRAASFDIRKPERLLIKLLETRNVDYLLLRPKLEEYSRRAGKDLYFGYNGGFHWNSDAHLLVAQLIYNKLEGYKLTPKTIPTTLKDKSFRSSFFKFLN